MYYHATQVVAWCLWLRVGLCGVTWWFAGVTMMGYLPVELCGEGQGVGQNIEVSEAYADGLKTLPHRETLCYHCMVRGRVTVGLLCGYYMVAWWLGQFACG